MIKDDSVFTKEELEERTKVARALMNATNNLMDCCFLISSSGENTELLFKAMEKTEEAAIVFLATKKVFDDSANRAGVALRERTETNVRHDA